MMVSLKILENWKRGEKFLNGMILPSGILDVFVNIGSAVVDNWSVIEPIAWGLVAALVAYNAVAVSYTHLLLGPAHEKHGGCAAGPVLLLSLIHISVCVLWRSGVRLWTGSSGI